MLNTLKAPPQPVKAVTIQTPSRMARQILAAAAARDLA